LITAFFTACSPVRDPAVESTLAKHGDVRHQPGHFPDIMPDPYEPLNRGLWTVNHGLLRGLIQPSGRVYRTIVPPPARQSINHFTRNITYPGRVVNHALQGRWDGAGQESLRFICNTTAGAAGFFDVASKWNMPKSEADFGQTFVRWGWKPHGYLMLPLLGPSDDVHAAGLLVDEAFEPWNYFTPYAYASTGSTYNNLTDKVEVASQYIQTESDAYVGVKYLWTYGSKDKLPDFRTKGPIDIPTLETIAVSRIHTKDPSFIERTREMSVRLPATGRNMKFNCWLQPGPAPLVYVSPGLSMHRLSDVTLSQAECLYQNGFSVVTITGVFHPEFMESASTTALPGYSPIDNHDLLVLLTEIDRKLDNRYPGMFGKKALLGSSWGGFQALELAATEKISGEGLLHFDRYVGLDIPVDRDYAISRIDGYYDAPKAWPASERQGRVNNTIHKATVIASVPPEMLTGPPFDAVESKFLIGLFFRFTLRDSIYCSQSRNDMGILQTPFSNWHREASYQEILNYSYKDYLSKFVTPYYKQRGISKADLAREGSLRTYGKQLHLLQNVRVIVNQNDFILSPQDISWLKSTIAPSHLTVLPNGGHLGNLASEAVQKKIIESLSGLK
jgi:ABC-type transporter lipoprotein component MlaA/pimeloyl-ACP methyl ester carboxylesterase